TTDPELVSGQRRNLQWRCGRPQQQNPSGDQTILRLSHLRSHGNCPLSQLGAAPRTGISPQILLRRLISHAPHTMSVFATVHSPPRDSGSRKQIVHLLRRCEPKGFEQSEHLPSVAASFSARSVPMSWPCAPIGRARELAAEARRWTTPTSGHGRARLPAVTRVFLIIISYPNLCVLQEATQLRVQSLKLV